MKIESFEGEYRFLSNFYESVIEREGIRFATAEAAYAAAKTDDPTWKARIALASSPNAAKKLGRGAPLRPTWESEKLVVMEEILRMKFADERLRDKLTSTAPVELVEGNWWGDTFWGVCKGVGENHLGRLLMKIRDEGRRFAA